VPLHEKLIFLSNPNSIAIVPMLKKNESLQVPKQKRGQIAAVRRCYGTSVLGFPLEVFLPLEAEISYLVLAGHHGDEPETTAILSATLRALPAEQLTCAVILAANPDGLARGTRANARGVDLNRNFPTTDWSDAPVLHSWIEGEPKSVELSTGSEPASEPETQALLDLVREFAPRAIVSLHARLGCIDDPGETELGRWLARETELPLVNDIGYPTLGSFGTWAQENNISLITVEFANESIVAARQRMAPVLDLLLTLE